ncbi:MAG: Uncharacterized protein Athens041674_534 [Parcubacteria group bacterium Athens0416_74]|nr:MAG: Uncharacterized protein Athens041674_534 [Parcubacteria group bacterium Athens0416_74]
MAITLCVVLGAGGIVVRQNAAETQGSWVNRQPSESQRVWTEKIRALGGKAAYAALAEEIKDMTPEDQHTSAHAFGAALFAVEDNAGLSVCDARFSYGCFHEFMGNSIASHGLSVVSELNEGCIESLVESPLSCQHGIGHGIFAYLGYDDESLFRSLRECAALPYNDPIGGCYGGVFMEYNMQTMLGRQGQLRAVDSGDDLYKPCVSIESRYRASCAFWQPQWWHIAILHAESTEKSFAQLGAYCREMTDTKALRRECFQGIGNITNPATDFDAARSRELCDATSSDRLERLYCRAYAANSLSRGGAGKIGDGEALCDGLPQKERDFCLAYARNEANLVNVLESPL